MALQGMMADPVQSGYSISNISGQNRKASKSGAFDYWVVKLDSAK